MARPPERDEEPRSWRDRFEDEAAAEQAARDLRLSLVGLRERIWSIWSRTEEELDAVASGRPRPAARPDDRAD